MIWLILLAFVAFLCFLFLSPIHIRFSYDGAIRLSVRYLFVNIPLYPKKPKKKKPKKKKKTKTEPISPKKPEKPKKAKKKPMPRLGFADIRMLLKLALRFLREVLDKASGHLKIRVRRLQIILGGAEDAAAAAIEYGLISQSVAYLFAALDETPFLKTRRRDTRQLSVDFLAKEHRFAADIDVTCPLIQTLSLAVFAFLRGTRTYKKFKAYRLHRAAKKQNSVSGKESFHG